MGAADATNNMRAAAIVFFFAQQNQRLNSIQISDKRFRLAPATSVEFCEEKKCEKQRRGDGGCGRRWLMEVLGSMHNHSDALEMIYFVHKSEM